jgi:pyruvate ferredoxin oxidoreductase alpha subunit
MPQKMYFDAKRKRSGRMSFKMLDGNAAAVEAMCLAEVKVISAYPITPQSSIAEKLSSLVAEGALKAEYIRVESEHTAMSAATTAQLTGIRAATATSSVGLALMHEVLGLTAGLRVPIVMPVVNRALVAPWSLWCDHGDTMAERDSGWMQFFTQNVQDVLDLMLVAYAASEHEDILLPSMVCLDGFFLSHSMQKVDVPDIEQVRQFIGPYKPKNSFLDASDPMFINDLTGPDEFTEMRYQQAEGFKKALELIPGIMKDFERFFGRKLFMVEEYQTADAEVILVALGSMCGTIKQAVNDLRAAGRKAGLLRITAFRPFPSELIQRALAGKAAIGVFDRSAGLGSPGGPLWNEVRSALTGTGTEVVPFIGGLGGRDIPPATVEKAFKRLFDLKEGKEAAGETWIDLKENPMEKREIQINV